MSVGYHFAEVVRTALVCATITFLGYLGYTLFQTQRASAPPPISTAGTEELEEIQGRLGGLDRRVDALQRQRQESRKRDDRTGGQKAALETVRAKHDAEILELQQRADALAARIQSLRRQFGLIPDGTTVEYGIVEFSSPDDYEEGDDGGGCWRLKFKNEYASAPTVLTSQVDRTKAANKRHWVQAVAEDVTTTGCLVCITVRPQNRIHRYRVAYFVIGKVM